MYTERVLYRVSIALVVFLVALPSLRAIANAQDTAPQRARITLKEGARIRVQLMQDLTSRTANVGDVFDGEVTDDVDVDGVVVITRGARVTGTVTAVQKAAWLGRPGRLGFSFDLVRAVDGTNVRLRATMERVGQGNEAAAWGLGLILFLPLLLISGKEMEVKRGTSFPAFVDRDTVVVAAVPAPGSPSAIPLPPAQITPAASPQPLVTPPASSSPAPAVTAQASRIRVLREASGSQEFGVLVIGDMVVLRVGSSFEGMHQVQRTERVAERLRALLDRGLRAEEITSGYLPPDRHVIFARDEILLTVDAELATQHNSNPAQLATQWAERIREGLRSLR